MLKDLDVECERKRGVRVDFSFRHVQLLRIKLSFIEKRMTVQGTDLKGGICGQFRI